MSALYTHVSGGENDPWSDEGSLSNVETKVPASVPCLSRARERIRGKLWKHPPYRHFPTSVKTPEDHGFAAPTPTSWTNEIVLEIREQREASWSPRVDRAINPQDETEMING